MNVVVAVLLVAAAVVALVVGVADARDRLRSLDRTREQLDDEQGGVE